MSLDSGVPFDLLIATMSAFKATREIKQRRDVISAYALCHVLSHAHDTKIVRLRVVVTPKSKKRLSKSVIRHLLLVDGEWLLDPALIDLNDEKYARFPEVMMIPVHPSSRISFRDFGSFSLCYRIFSDQRNVEDAKLSEWEPVARNIQDDIDEHIGGFSGEDYFAA